MKDRAEMTIEEVTSTLNEIHALVKNVSDTLECDASYAEDMDRFQVSVTRAGMVDPFFIANELIKKSEVDWRQILTSRVTSFKEMCEEL